MRGVSQVEPNATVVVILSGPFGRSFDSESIASVIASLAKTSRAVRIQQLALLGQDQAARMAMEQRHAEAFLERADLAADRGLAEIERLAGMGEAARLGDGVKHPQLVPVHRRCPSQRAAPASTASRARCYSAAARGRGFLLRGEEFLGLERRHAAHAGGGHRLAEDLVLDVAGGKDARDRRSRSNRARVMI